MKTLSHRVLIVLLVAAMWMTACQGGSAATGAPAQDTPAGSNATEAAQPSAEVFSIPKPVSLDPANADDNSRAVVSYLFDGLVKIQDNQVAPALAASWVVSDDGLDYIFTLRPSVTFHDGTPLDADAVMANFNRWFDPANSAHGSGAYSAWKSSFGGFKGEVDADGKPVPTFDGIEKVNSLTVLIHLNQPDPNFLVKLAAPEFGIVSPAALANVAADPKAAIGAGAYQLGEWTDTGLVLTPNAAYWAGAPAGDLTFKFQ
jgi:peptide/nickel transport system substrate-binding protein